MIAYMRQAIYEKTGDEADKTLPFIFGTICHNSTQYNATVEKAQLQVAQDVEGVYYIDMSDVICDDLDCDIAGSGDIKVRQVTTGNTMVSIAGSGDVGLNFQQCGSVKVKIAGSGDVKLKGKADHFDMKVGGSGKVDTSELITK